MHSKFLIPLLTLLSILLFSCENDSPVFDESFPCENGLADGTYPCENVGLYAHISADELGGQRLNDIWGWTDPQTGKEYALVGLFDGVSFVDISNPNNPIVVGKLNEAEFATKLIPTEAEEEFPACIYGIGSSEAAKNILAGSTWRDVKVFDNHAFIVADGQIHGMQVFDLTRLRSYEGTKLTFTEDAFYDKLGNAHNIAINEATGFAYAIGVTNAEVCGDRNGTGLHIIDINDPKNPAFAGCYIDSDTDLPSAVDVGVGYIHDTQCVVYGGPDSEHQGKEVCVSSAEGAVVITDVSDKSNPQTIGFSGQSRMQYSHQGWLTEDHRYFLMNDELDETRIGRNTKTYIWDMRDLDNPVFIDHYSHDTPNIDHNLYVLNNKVYQTNYTAGLRIFELGDLENAELIPAGFFDTTPGNNTIDYEGTWSNYPYFESGVVIVSDINNGLFILNPHLD